MCIIFYYSNKFFLSFLKNLLNSFIKQKVLILKSSKRTLSFTYLYRDVFNMYIIYIYIYIIVT